VHHCNHLHLVSLNSINHGKRESVEYQASAHAGRHFGKALGVRCDGLNTFIKRRLIAALK